MGRPLAAWTSHGARLGAITLVLLACAGLFGATAHEVTTGGPLVRLDAQAAQWLHEHATPRLTSVLVVWTHAHSTTAVAVYAALCAAFLTLRHRWRGAVTLVVAVGGVLALNVLLKLTFRRARPAFDEPLLTLSTYSFPSGHVAASTVAYGLGVAWVFVTSREPRWRLLASSGAAAAILLVAFSRMYLGVHYLSDVSAGFAEGVAWLTVSLVAIDTVWRRLGLPQTPRPEPSA